MIAGVEALELLREAFDHLHTAVREDMAEIDPAWLRWQPWPARDHTGFLHLHLVRDEDAVLSHLAGQPGTREADAWQERTGIDAPGKRPGDLPARTPGMVKAGTLQRCTSHQERPGARPR